MSKKNNDMCRKVDYFLEKAKKHNNAGRYKKAIANINIASSIIENDDNKVARKLAIKILKAKDIVSHNYLVKREREIESMFNFIQD